MAQSSRDHIAHRLRHREALSGDRLELRAFHAEQPNDLTDEERVALCLVGESGYQFGRGHLGGSQFDVRRDVCCAEPGETDT